MSAINNSWIRWKFSWENVDSMHNFRTGLPPESYESSVSVYRFFRQKACHFGLGASCASLKR